MDLRHETGSPQRSHHMDPHSHRTPTRRRPMETQRPHAHPMHHRMGPPKRRRTTTHHHRNPPQPTTNTGRSHDSILPKNQRGDHRRKKKILAAATQGTIEDLAICTAMGWTAEQLQAQPARFIERLTLYLDALAREREREQRRHLEQLRRLGLKP